MAEETQKTPLEYARDIINQLKEMQHYAQTNAEKLSSQWLAFSEGEFKNKLFAEKVGDLLNKQGAYVEELQGVINDMELECNRIENEA
ncbi:hypothetical protein [Neisseria montereyensis]|uniref:Uncharacterized protein n=1 Tax=Neisseria montereyensis TaxID=2973938 RepID=A0ABT2F9H2_9NEIS|nr:hypothetical protein [Neisseria montereyensis]MCS4532750.1 hypothetical protein [Neisseria montereyensis]